MTASPALALGAQMTPEPLGRIAGVHGTIVTLVDAGTASAFRPGDRLAFNPDRACGRALRTGTVTVRSADPRIGTVTMDEDVRSSVVAVCEQDWIYRCRALAPPPVITHRSIDSMTSFRAGMSADDLDAIHRDTSPAIAQFHAETGITIGYRVYEQPEDEHGPAQWVLEIRLGSPATHVEILDVDAWRALRGETASLWREFVLDCCEGGRRAMAARARRR